MIRSLVQSQRSAANGERPVLPLRVGVVVKVLEGRFMDMFVGVGFVPVRVRMGDVLVLVARMGMLVDFQTMIVLVVVWCVVSMLCCHLLTSLVLGACAVNPIRPGPRPSVVT